MSQALADHLAGAAPTDAATLGPIQRAYLIGDHDGLELRGPARYYIGCDVDTARVAGIGDRLRRLVRANGILRTRVGADLSLSMVPGDAAAGLDADIRPVDPGEFDAVNGTVRDELTCDEFDFDGWPLLRVVVVRSPTRVRLHLVYALWLMDAASLDIFLTELLTDRSGGNAPSMTSGGPGSARRDRSARDERFWRKRAKDFPDAVELPLRSDWRGASRKVTHRMVALDAATAARIAHTAAEHGLTPAMVYLAAYGVTLGRLGGGVAHTVTVLHAQRAHPVTVDSLGNAGTTMPMAIPAASDGSFAEITRTVQGRFLSQAMHSSLSGAEIARLGDPSRDLSRLPYPFTFTALEVDDVAEERLGLRRRWDEAQLRVPQVLIDHQVIMESGGGVRLGFDWRTEAFDAGFVADFVDQHTTLLARLAESGQRWIRPPQCVPRSSPVRPASGPVGDTLHDRVLRTAAQSPESPAVHDALGALSYAELVEQAWAVADRLLGAGAETGDRVAVHLPRGREQVVAILGSLLAGCVFIPLDYATPNGRLDSIARRAEMRFVITTGGRAAEDRWRNRGTRPLPAVAFGARYGQPRPRSCSTAYAIFTSGSTGEPKGVVISHSAVINTIDAVNRELGLRKADRVLSVSSIGFDLSVYDIFGPLFRGGCAVMLSEQAARSPAAWVELIERHGVTIWNSAPALASLLAEEGSATPSVRAFMLSGDWIPLTLPAALRQLAPAADVISLGGATEGSIWSIYHRIRDEDRAGRSIPYGTPLPGQDILVLDAARQVCANWQIGEIYLAGGGVADGYLNDPVKTEAAFLNDPRFGWIYRTGDRGRRHPSGVIEFLGRTDTQVKLNGHRVELGEIEHLLEKSDAIRRAAACIRGEGRRKHVIAYVSLASQAPRTWRQDVTAALTDALPRYMVPARVTELDEIPLTSSGKVDRRQLEALPVQDGPTMPAPPPPPPDLFGHVVTACWQEVLGEPPGQGTFFDAGGGSYDAIRLLSLLRGRFGYHVSFGDFMADPTVPGLAARCRRTRGSSNSKIWTFQPRPTAAPRIRLVLFPPVGGGVSCYLGLIRYLAVDIDVHLIGFEGPLVRSPNTLTMTQLARGCLRQLRAESLTGGIPLVFAGWSFGGALAYEAARICPTPVERILVIDTPVSAGARRHGEPSVEAFARDIEETSGMAIDIEELTTDQTLRNKFEVYRQNLTLLRDWAPSPSDAHVVEFRAAVDPAEPDIGAWGRTARVAQVVLLNGGHFAVFDGDNARLVRDAIEGTPR